jgi:hypothetical protein
VGQGNKHIRYMVKVTNKKIHCCNMMEVNVQYRCNDHSSPFECPDCLVYYNEDFEEYGIIIHDGTGDIITISHCPWCGNKLPKSSREVLIKMLVKLGIDPSGELI